MIYSIHMCKWLCFLNLKYKYCICLLCGGFFVLFYVCVIPQREIKVYVFILRVRPQMYASERSILLFLNRLKPHLCRWREETLEMTVPKIMSVKLSENIKWFLNHLIGFHSMVSSLDSLLAEELSRFLGIMSSLFE